MNVTFHQTLADEPFTAIDRARAALKVAGFSIGSGQRGSPTGLLAGEYVIPKWRNMNARERAELHGVIEGDNRCGPVTVTLKSNCPAHNRSLFSRACWPNDPEQVREVRS